MKSNFLIPLGSLCLALPAVRQLHIGQQFTPPFTTDATTEATINTQASPNIALTTKIPTASLITRSGESVSAAPRSLDQLKSLILDGLENSPDTNLFAALLRGQPDLFKLLNPESDYTILAPNNSAVKRANLPYLREGMGYSHQLALSFVERGPVDPPLAAGPRTLKTTLRDIKYVGLGPGQSARLVSSPEGAGLRIVSGMQQGVAFGGQAYPFGAGAIYVGEEQLPRALPSTLIKTNGIGFQEYLFHTLEFRDLFFQEQVTVFALNDAAIASAGDSLKVAVLRQHIIPNFLGYTPDLVPGKAYRTAAGGHLMISIKDGEFLVNGIKILQPNVIIQTGVVHYVEKAFSPYKGPRLSSNGTIEDALGRSSGRPAINPFIMLLAIAAAIAGYCLMA